MQSRNLVLLTSMRVAASIVTPILSSKLFELSCRGVVVVGGAGGGSIVGLGALLFVTGAFLALAVASLPMLLMRMEESEQ